MSSQFLTKDNFAKIYSNIKDIIVSNEGFDIDSDKKYKKALKKMAISFHEHFKNIGFKNPFNSNENGTACNLSPNYNFCDYKGAGEGQVIISITGSNVPFGNTFRITIS